MRTRSPARPSEPPLFARPAIAVLTVTSLLSPMCASPSAGAHPSFTRRRPVVAVADLRDDLRTLHEMRSDRARRVVQVPARTAPAKPRVTAAPKVHRVPARTAPVRRVVRAPRRHVTAAPVTYAAGSGSAITRYALMFLGRPYVYGAAGPSAFDCSGLVQYVYAHFGIRLPHLAAAFYGVGRAVPYSQIQPGDILVLNGGGHAAIALGAGLMLHAPHTGDHVRIAKISGFSAARRVVG